MSDWTENKNEKSFSELYQRYTLKLLKYTRWIVSDVSAEDIVQEVFEKIFLHPQKYDQNQSFATWLFVMAKHQALSNIKKETTREKYQHQMSSQVLSESLESGWTKEKEVIRRAIKSLPPNHVEVISLKYSSNFSIEEIGEILNISKGTVKSRLHYGLMKLKEIVRTKKLNDNE